jgi:ubiquinone/menaquinone biosynthesis C-methylase UbiE
MLPRVLEPEVMDSTDDAADYDAMDHSEVNRRFVADFLAVSPDLSNVLDVGTGTALIPIELCGAASPLHITAIDLAFSMLDVARSNLQRTGLSDRVTVALVDAKQLPYPNDQFSAVMSNSIVHHIPDPLPVLREAVRVCRPNGVIFFRDLMRPVDQETLEQLVNTYAGNANAHQRQLFDDSLHAALAVAEMRELVSALGFDTKSVQATSDRHWTWSAQKLTPRREMS